MRYPADPPIIEEIVMELRSRPPTLRLSLADGPYAP
jgi:hypothetical protein